MHETACAYALSPTEENLQKALLESLPLCALIARRFLGRGAEYDDLYQVACLACVQAIRAFDPSRQLKFTTFVTPTITGQVRNYLRDRAPLLRTPRALREQGAALARAREAWVQAHHREPSVRELAESLKWEAAQVLLTLSSQERTLSLDQTDEDGLSLADRIAFLEQEFEKREQRQDLSRALARLSPLERQLLSLRFAARLSQRETAARLSLTQMQVSRMERRALDALRKEMEA